MIRLHPRMMIMRTRAFDFSSNARNQGTSRIARAHRADAVFTH
jgi:hypothetical protein